MDGATARALVLDESFGENGIVLLLRMGDDPGRQRMRRLLTALHVILEEWRGVATLDRAMAHALYSLAAEADAHVASWARQGRVWREELADDEIPNIMIAVESIFADDAEEMDV